jgi:hypothetical protein
MYVCICVYVYMFVFMYDERTPFEVAEWCKHEVCMHVCVCVCVCIIDERV